MSKTVEPKVNMDARVPLEITASATFAGPQLSEVSDSGFSPYASSASAHASGCPEGTNVNMDMQLVQGHAPMNTLSLEFCLEGEGNPQPVLREVTHVQPVQDFVSVPSD